MILTGKAKEDFEIWLLKEGNEVIKNGTIEYDLYYMCKYMIPEIMVYAKVVEWFDSVKCSVFKSLWSYCFGNNYNPFVDDWCSYIEQAIIKANQIYNEN